MPKASDKTKGSQKRKKPSNNSNNENTESEPVPKKKKSERKSCLEGIEVSKQLASELQEKRVLRARKPTNKGNEPRVCGNGKAMPPLAELEAMYDDDSEDDQAPPPVAPTDRCATPEQKPSTEEPDLNSPTTLKHIASRVIDLISKTIVIDDDGKPPPVIPQKKPKKSGKPYIVGCKERKQVPWAPKTKFCVGSDKYGVDENQSSDDEDDGCSKKRRKRGKKVNLSKSKFNAKSDEIAAKLKESDNIANAAQIHGSPDSTSTIEYDFPSNSPPTNIPRSFSPLPSTSMDSETILRNDRLFNKSMQCESLSNDSQNDVEIIEVPCETIIIDDTISTPAKKTDWNCETMEDDCCILVEQKDGNEQAPANIKKSESPPKDDFYGSIDLTEPFDNQVYEIGDDDIEIVMAENQAILKKDRRKRNIDTVTSVDPNVIIVEESTSESNAPSSISTTNTSNSDVKTQNHNADSSNKIASIVNNFFSPEPERHQCYYETREGKISELIELTKTLNILKRLQSWMSTGFRCHNTPQPDVTPVEDSHSNHSTTQMPSNINVGVKTHASQAQSNNNGIEVNKPLITGPKQRTSRRKSAEPSPPGRSLGDCPICMDSLVGNQVASTLCGHIFCMPCIKAAIRANGKKCPTCRKTLKGSGYHQIFL